MTEHGAKSDLLRCLRTAREVLLWKLEGLGEYDIRRPMTPTGTNLLGLVKHAAGVEAGYFGFVFGRPFPEHLPWLGAMGTADAEDNADMWATPEESRAGILALYGRVAEHADATVEALPLDAAGTVPWWRPEAREVTLHRILVHVISDLQRHAGHADIVRELLDGAVGMRRGNENLPPGEQSWWRAYRDRLEDAAQAAAKS